RPLRLSNRTIFIKGFIDDIPAMDFAFVSTCYCLDVIFHSRDQGLFAQWLVVFVHKNPSWGLLVPYQAMAYSKRSEFFTQSNILISKFEIISVDFWMYQLPLQSIFRTETVEVVFD